MLQRSEPDTTNCLDNLVKATQPYLEAAAATQDAEPASISVVLNAGAALTLDVLHVGEDGHARTFHALIAGQEGEAVAAALAAFVVTGLNQLPIESREVVGRLLADAGGEIQAVVDPVFHSADGRLVVAGRPPVDLFGLQAGFVH